LYNVYISIKKTHFEQFLFVGSTSLAYTHGWDRERHPKCCR